MDPASVFHAQVLKHPKHAGFVKQRLINLVICSLVSTTHKNEGLVEQRMNKSDDLQYGPPRLVLSTLKNKCQWISFERPQGQGEGEGIGNSKNNVCLISLERATRVRGSDTENGKIMEKGKRGTGKVKGKGQGKGIRNRKGKGNGKGEGKAKGNGKKKGKRMAK